MQPHVLDDTFARGISVKDVIRYRVFGDFESEEGWLNDMADKGLALVRFAWGAYRFEPGEPGDWVYRIELLPRPVGDPRSREYLELLAEPGV
jgi:hypothetical protein